MENNCEACKQVITTTRLLKCVCCKADYHPICVNVSTSDLTKLTAWQCPMCRAKEPKVGNLSTPVRISDLPEVSNANASSRAHKRLALSSPGGEDREEFESDSVASELRLLRADMAEIKSFLKLLAEGIGNCNSRLDSFEERIRTLEEKDSSIILSLRDSVELLQDQLSQQTQAALKNELEIIGISETSNENLEHIAMITATKLGVNLPESDIDWVTRAGPKNGRHNSNDTTPRPIIIRLTRKTKRDEIIKAAKVRRNIVITSADLDILGPPRKIYINEHLSKENRMLFRDARLRSRQLGFRFCWIKNGRVHVRKDEGKPAILIKASADLDRTLPQGPNCSSQLKR